MLPSGSPPEFFVDRSLGRHLADALRAAGAVVHGMADVDGERIGQELDDEERNLPRIVRVAERPGPYIYGVYPDELRLLWPKL